MDKLDELPLSTLLGMLADQYDRDSTPFKALRHLAKRPTAHSGCSPLACLRLGSRKERSKPRVGPTLVERLIGQLE